MDKSFLKEIFAILIVAGCLGFFVGYLMGHYKND